MRDHVERRVGTGGGGRERSGGAEAGRLEIGGVSQVQEEVREVWLAVAGDALTTCGIRRGRSCGARRFTDHRRCVAGAGDRRDAAIYSLVNQVILQALPVREPERLVLVDWKGPHWRRRGFGAVIT